MTYANLCPTHGARPVGWRTMVPAGFFSLNTKNLTGKVWVAERTFLHNGHPTNYLPRSCREAERVSRLLRGAMGRPVAVRGMLVVMCDEFTLKAQPLGVVVVRRR